MLFLWLNKTPPKEILLLVFKRVLIYHFEKLLSPAFEHNRMPIYNILGNTKFLKLVVVRSGPFALGSYFPPLWHESPKTKSLEPFWSPPLVINKWVKIIPKTKSFCLVLMLSPPSMESATERRRRMNYGVEAFVFAEDSDSLSIHLWLGLKFTDRKSVV